MSASNDNIASNNQFSKAQPITLEDLPSPNTRRWVISRKAAVVSAVQSGLISQEDACSRYSLSLEEFQSWQKAIAENGVAGLRVTRVQHYRKDCA